MAKQGDFYWVFAHVTPTFGANEQVTGYHSSRRVPERAQVELFTDIYRQLLAEERRHADWQSGMEAAGKMLGGMLPKKRWSMRSLFFRCERSATKTAGPRPRTSDRAACINPSSLRTPGIGLFFCGRERRHAAL